jgi:hypothetical protein
MKNFTIITIICLLLFGSNHCFAQIKKLDAAIAALNSTEFILKYKELKELVEKDGREFKKTHTDAENARMKVAYSKSCQQLDAIVDGLKNDILNKKQRKYIIENPQRYTEYLSHQIKDAQSFHNNNFGDAYAEITGGAAGSSILLVTLIPLLIEYIPVLIKTVHEIDIALKKMSQEFLEENFIKKIRVTPFEKL